MDPVNHKAEHGTLFIVATPIGHLDDLTRRAENVLRQVQIIAAEDTRRTAGLLAHLDHRVPELISLHDHNETQQTQRLIDRLMAGADVALVSDAGTPLINDPGFVLVQQAHAHDIPCVPIPGCSSVITALSVCPLPCQTFTYRGFVPPKAGARASFLKEVLASPDAIVLFEVPHRIHATLEELAKQTDRRLMLARELTKRFETLYVGLAEEVAQALGPDPKGEMVMVIEAAPQTGLALDQRHVLDVLLKEMSPSQAARVGAALLGVRRKDLYAAIQDETAD